MAAIGVSALAIFAAQIAVAMIIISLGWDINELSPLQTYFVGALSITLPLAGIYYYVDKKKGGLLDVGLGPKPHPFIKPLAKNFGLYILATMVVVLAVSILAPAVDLDQAQDLGLGDGPVVWYEYLFLGLLLVVLTPISEEVIFRGFMLKGLASRFGWTTAALVSSLLFGMVHGQLNVAIDTAIMGWFSAQLAISTKSLWPSIAMHSLKNGLAFCLVYLSPLL